MSNWWYKPQPHSRLGRIWVPLPNQVVVSVVDGKEVFWGPATHEGLPQPYSCLTLLHLLREGRFVDSVKTNITKIYIPSWVVRRTEYLKFLGDSHHIVTIQDKFPRLVLLQQLHVDACLVLVPFSHRVERFGFSVKFYKMCHNTHNKRNPSNPRMLTYTNFLAHISELWLFSGVTQFRATNARKKAVEVLVKCTNQHYFFHDSTRGILMILKTCT